MDRGRPRKIDRRSREVKSASLGLGLAPEMKKGTTGNQAILPLGGLPRYELLKLRSSSLIPFHFAISLGFSYSYSALAVLVLVLEDTATSTSTSTISLSTSTVRNQECATSKLARRAGTTDHGEVSHKDVLIEFLVLHWGFLSPKVLPLPTQIPDGPFYIRETQTAERLRTIVLVRLRRRLIRRVKVLSGVTLPPCIQR